MLITIIQIITVFLKMDAGMTDVLRPSLYGAIHPLTIFPASGDSNDVGDDSESVVVVGHCCESGDLMTPKEGEPEAIGERELRKAEIGDMLGHTNYYTTETYLSGFEQKTLDDAADKIFSSTTKKKTKNKKK